MSGIFGFLDLDRQLPPDAAQRMARALSVAPGSRARIVVSGPACIGVVDKGIFPGSSQVLRAADSSREAVFQGEMLSEGESDVGGDPIERARRLFCHTLDDHRLARANGPFTAAILDTAGQTIEVAGDRYQRYLTFYIQIGRTVLFAGAIKALLACGLFPAELNPDAFGLMLTIGEVAGDLTLVRGVRVIPSGTIASIDERGISFRSFWRYAFRESPQMGFRRSAERSGELLRQAVNRVCASHETVGVPLSGGLDSRMLLAACPDASRVPSFTWGISGCRDLRYARRVADALGSPHESHVYDPTYIERLGERGVWLTEGLCDAADMHVLPYVETVAARCPVLLDGFAGDVLLGGNFIKRRWWEARGVAEAAEALWSWRAGLLKPEIGRALLGEARYTDVVERARRLFCDCFAGYAAETEMSRVMAFLMDNRMRRCSIGGAHLFRWRVELHMPFYDNDFFDHVSCLPHAWRFRHRVYIEMIRRCFASVGRVPWQRTGLPARTRWPARFFSACTHRAGEWATKRLGWPDLFSGRHVSRFDLWFRGPLRPYVQEVLGSERFLSRGLVRAEGVRAVLKAHEAGVNHSKLIGVLLAMELFHRLFIDDLAGATRTYGTGLTGGFTLEEGAHTVAMA